MLRFYGPVDPVGSGQPRPVYLPTLVTVTGQAKSCKQLTSIVHILLPVTDNFPSWISGGERMTIENISWSISTKKLLRILPGLNPQPPDHQSEAHATESLRLAKYSDTLSLHTCICRDSRSSTYILCVLENEKWLFKPVIRFLFIAITVQVLHLEQELIKCNVLLG